MKNKWIQTIVVFSLILAGCSADSDAGNGASNDSVGGSLATFALKGDYLYVVDTEGLNVFSVANTQNPVKVNTVSVGFAIETLFSLDDYLFIGSQNGMYIYSIANPENPQKLSEYRHFTACDPVVANDSYAFVTLHSTTFCGNDLNVLQVYDIADIEKPVKIHERGLTYPRGLALNGNYLAICDDELKFFSIENPKEPYLVHSENKNYKDLIFYDGRLFAFGEKEITQYGWSKSDFSDLYVISTLKY